MAAQQTRLRDISPHLSTLPVLSASPSRGSAKACAARVIANTHVSDRYWLMRLYAPEVAESAYPGQFAMLTVSPTADAHPILPRPMALYDWDRQMGWIDIVYGVVGIGSSRLTDFCAGEQIAVVGPLGRGFDLAPGAGRVLIIGRGIGVCSLSALSVQAAEQGVLVTSVLSARDREALVGRDPITKASGGGAFEVYDSDGSSGPRRLATMLERRFEGRGPGQIFTCGSHRLALMCAELATAWDADLQVSIEARMACGLGYCHGCSTGQRTSGAEAPLVCKDGPVFRWITDGR